jgi:hypothetical protein
MEQPASAFEQDLVLALQRIANGRRLNQEPSRRMSRYELQNIAEQVLNKYKIEFGKDTIQRHYIPLKSDCRPGGS